MEPLRRARRSEDEACRWRARRRDQMLPRRQGEGVEGRRARGARGANRLASLDHPALPKYVEHFEEDGALYLVMEKIEGESLASLRAKGQTLAPGEIAKMLADIAAALKYSARSCTRDRASRHQAGQPHSTARRLDRARRLRRGARQAEARRREHGRRNVRVHGAGAIPGTRVAEIGCVWPRRDRARDADRLRAGGAPARRLGDRRRAGGSEGTSSPLIAALEAMLEPDPDRRIDSVDEALALLAKPPARPKARSGSRRRSANGNRAHRERRVRRAIPCPWRRGCSVGSASSSRS